MRQAEKPDDPQSPELSAAGRARTRSLGTFPTIAGVACGPRRGKGMAFDDRPKFFDANGVHHDSDT